jgi:flagellar assembly protein FliH
MDAEFSFETLEDPVAAVAGAHAPVESELEALRAAARAEGFEQGRAEGLAGAQLVLATLDAAAQACAETQAALSASLEAEAVELALSLAQKILAGAVAVDPSVVLEAVRGALRGLVDRERVTVLVHPDDLALVREAVGGIEASLGGIEHCEVQAERRVSRGGAVVRGPDGDVDARVETKLERAREVVEAALADGP